MPRDNFRRERERRIVGAIQFNNVGRKLTIEGRFHAYKLSQNREIVEKSTNFQVTANLTFLCFDCKMEISTTGEEREKRATIICPKCNKKYKLHPSYANHEGEIVEYEKTCTRQQTN